MPIYEYECSNCGKRFDKLQSITAEPLTECANCGSGPIRRVMQPVGIIFKGSGWYITDNRKSGDSSASSSGKADKDTGDAKGENADKGTSDTKSTSDAKGESSSASSTKKDSSKPSE